MCTHRSDLNDLRPRHDELLIHRCCRSAKRLEQKCYIETLFHVVHPARRKNAFSVCEPRIAITAKRSPINFSNLRQGMRKGVQSHQLYVIISSKRLELLGNLPFATERIKLEITRDELIKEIIFNASENLLFQTRTSS